MTQDKRAWLNSKENILRQIADYARQFEQYDEEMCKLQFIAQRWGAKVGRLFGVNIRELLMQDPRFDVVCNRKTGGYFVFVLEGAKFAESEKDLDAATSQVEKVAD